MTSPTFSQGSFNAALARLVARAQVLSDEMTNRLAPGRPGPVITTEPSKRYARIWKADRTDLQTRSIYAFVDQTTGDIYAADSYRKPAPRVRGNLFAPDGGFGCLGPSGAA
jgi:hypothetical protein